VLEDLMDALNAVSVAGRSSGDDRVTTLRSTAEAMLRWLSAMRHEDGEIPFFNDAALGVAPSPQALDAYAARLGLTVATDRRVPLTFLEPSGYACLRGGSALVMASVGGIGPDEQ